MKQTVAEKIISKHAGYTVAPGDIAIIEVDGKREVVKEGGQLGDYSVTRIDGVRNCLTIVKRGSESGEDKREFCEGE